MRASPLKHPLAEIDRKHLRSKFRHPTGEVAVSARDLEDPLARLEPQQSFNGRLDEVPLPGSARLHALVPEGGQLVPR